MELKTFLRTRIIEQESKQYVAVSADETGMPDALLKETSAV